MTPLAAQLVERGVSTVDGFLPVVVRVVNVEDVDAIYAQAFEAIFEGAHDAVVAEVEHGLVRSRVVEPRPPVGLARWEPRRVPLWTRAHNCRAAHPRGPARDGFRFCPAPYSGAVSKRFSPKDRARCTTVPAWSSGMSPYRPPMEAQPKPRRVTRRLLLPRVTFSSGSMACSLMR